MTGSGISRPACDKLDLSQVGGLNNLIQLDIEDTDDGALVATARARSC